MTLWLITKSSDYYPGAGTQDWVLLTSDMDEAQAEFNRLQEPDEMGGYSVFFVRLNPADASYSLVDLFSVE